MVGACAWEDCATTVLATVISTAIPGQAVIDAGTKALGREPVRGVAGEGFGQLLEHPEVVVERMSEEHGVLEEFPIDTPTGVLDAKLIDQIAEHVMEGDERLKEDLARNRAHGVRGNTLETSWMVDARGREQP